MEAWLLTLCVFAVQRVTWQLLQVVLQQQLVARNPLDRLQHVVLQRQVPTHILFLRPKHTRVNRTGSKASTGILGAARTSRRITCMFWTTPLNCEDRCVQVLTRSMARSKFFTYSPYIFMNGASFWRMSPIRGLESLQREDS